MVKTSVRKKTIAINNSLNLEQCAAITAAAIAAYALKFQIRAKIWRDK